MKSTLISPLAAHQQSALREIAQRYAQAGYQCLLVGGSVRDLCLGMVPADFDFATNAPVDVSFSLFQKVIPTGVTHGTVTLRYLGKSYEVTRFRHDVETDGRHAVVKFAETIEEDLSRRDLRVNAMAYDLLENRWIDPQGGQEDIKNKLVRFVGDARERIKEDHLRGLRFVRMFFKLKPFGFRFLTEEWGEVKAVFDPTFLSIERIYDEVSKMSALPDCSVETVVTQLGELRPFRAFLQPPQEQIALGWMLERGDHTALGVLVGRASGTLKPPASLRLTKKEAKHAHLILSHWQTQWEEPGELKSFLSLIDPLYRETLCRLVQTLQGVSLIEEVRRIATAGEPLVVADLDISTVDLLRLGFEGRGLGEALKDLLRQAWLDPLVNQHPRLVQIAKSLWKIAHNKREL